MQLSPWVLVYLWCISSVICRRHTLNLKNDARPGILCSQFAYGTQGSLSVQLSGFSRKNLDPLVGFSLEKSTTNSLVTSSKQKSGKCFLENPTDKRIFSIRLEEKRARLMDRTDQSIIIMSSKKIQSFNFGGPGDEKTLKSLKPQISEFLNEYSTLSFDADNLADEIVKVINSDEQLRSQVLTSIKQSESAELAIYEILNILSTSGNSGTALQDDERNSNDVAEENPDKISRRSRRAVSPVKSEFDQQSALGVGENNEAIGRDQEDYDAVSGKRTPKVPPGNRVPLESSLISAQLDNKQSGRDEKNAIMQKQVSRNGDISVAKPQILISDGRKSRNVDDNHNQLPANLKGNRNADANENVQKYADGPNSRDSGRIDPSVDTPSLNNAMNHNDVRQGRDKEGDVNSNLKENLLKVDKGEPQNDALQVGKPSLNKPQLPNGQEGASQQRQNSPKAEVVQKPSEVGKANAPEISESHSIAHVSDFTANIIKEATTSFTEFQAHKGDSFRYTFLNEMASLNFTVSFTSSNEIGSYDLVFHNCLKAPIDASILMVEKNGDNYLSLGEQPLAMLFFVFSLIYAGLAVVWGCHLRFSKAPVFRMHHLMFAMVIVKSISLMFHSINYYVIGRHGVQEEGWAVMYYIAHMTRGFLLIVTILMIGAGWTFIKHVFTLQEKQVFAIVIPLQVFANIATIVINETEQGATRLTLWNEIFTVVDLLCCAGVLFPVIWSIRHLRQAAQSDGKVAQNLRKLRLFRHFYILVICYIYFTRIIIYLLRMTTPFAWSWLVELFEQSVTLVFFVSVGCKFRPFNDNPYLQLPTSDDTEDVVMQRFDVEQAWSQSGLADGVTRIHRPQGLIAARENRRRRDDAPNRPLPSETEAGDSDLLPLIRP